MIVGEGSTVYGLVRARALARPAARALTDGDRTLDYATLLHGVDRVAADLHARGLLRGDRLALLSENRLDYTLVQLACAKLGAIVACQNWRLAHAELRACVELVEPRLTVASSRFRERAAALSGGAPPLAIEALGAEGEAPYAARSEDGLLLIYTSGTTGLPKAAVISHRAEIARMAAMRLDLGLTADDGYVAWAPMFHMGGSEHLLGTLMAGGHTTILDGFDADAICDVVAVERIGWLMLVPATIAPVAERLAARGIRPKGVKAVGCMADLVPAAEIAAITSAVSAPFLDSFGATETGMPPLSGNHIPPGSPPAVFAKQPSSTMELRLVDAAGRDVADGEVGEAWVRGPTLFSGYWNAPEANAGSFTDGWFRMGDLFRRTAEGYVFAGRSKYLIKSGGENIYPAEIERLLFGDSRIADSVVVRRPDARWGEVPVAVVVAADPALDAETVAGLCRAGLSGYKQPREILIVPADVLPRNATGKILREAVEAMLPELMSLAHKG